MALLECSECGKDISSQAVACPHCGCPVDTGDKGPARPSEETEPSDASKPLLDPKWEKWGAQQADTSSSPATQSLAQPQPTSADQKQPGKGCTGCIGVSIAIFAILYIVGMFMPDAQVSESYKAGRYLGQLEGTMAYDSGGMRASEAALDAAARRATANVSFDTPEGRDDWIRGYKAGYSIGWDKAK